MIRKVCWMFVNTGITEGVRRQVMEHANGQMIMVGTASYDLACSEAKKLVEEGVVMIELCGGFGNIGVAKITEAVENKIPVGVIRFDNHPGYDNESGDIRWLGLKK
ncbi:MAG: DUF6506 family protein [Christensenellales bacterium]